MGAATCTPSGRFSTNAWWGSPLRWLRSARLPFPLRSGPRGVEQEFRKGGDG